MSLFKEFLRVWQSLGAKERKETLHFIRKFVPMITYSLCVPSQLLIVTSYNPVLESRKTETTDEVTRVLMLSLGIFESSNTRNGNNN
jgi:hypothetical protein